MAVLHRIEVNVVDMSHDVGLLSDRMRPEASLPDAPFASEFAPFG